MVNEGHVLLIYPVARGVPQGSPVLWCFFAVHTAGLIMFVKVRLQGVEGLRFVDDLGWVVTAKDMKQTIRKFEA